MKMNKLILMSFLVLILNEYEAQKIYSVNYESRADADVVIVGRVLSCSEFRNRSMDAGRFALDYEDESVDPCRFARTSIFVWQ
mgnify:CR=1 FL=1